jgi:dimethylamine monooxygenase subunit A
MKSKSLSMRQLLTLTFQNFPANTAHMLHKPYDGSSKPFTIGLGQLDPEEWIEVDADLAHYLDEKRRLYADETKNVLASEAGSETAQAEVLAVLVEHLPKRFPETYVRDGNTMHILGGRHHVNLTNPDLGPLAIAGQLVQEDFLLMRNSPDGWRLVAASLCFPSAWLLSEKFGKPMHAIHQPVPGFGKASRNDGLIGRMFDNLWPERPVMRWNWSLYGEAKLHYPAIDNQIKNRFGSGNIAGNVILRIERQTLRKLPQSGDIIFTVRIHLNPLEVLENHAEGPALARSIAAQVDALTDDEKTYKGLVGEMDRLKARLAEFY